MVLTGSPADVDPQRFGTARHPAAADPDPDRERTDEALIDYALGAGKPVLAICYGAQLLNVHFGGSLLQDIPSEMQTTLDHDQDENGHDGLHAVRIEGGHLAELASQLQARARSRSTARITRRFSNLAAGCALPLTLRTASWKR